MGRKLYFIIDENGKEWIAQSIPNGISTVELDEILNNMWENVLDLEEVEGKKLSLVSSTSIEHDVFIESRDPNITANARLRSEVQTKIASGNYIKRERNKLKDGKPDKDYIREIRQTVGRI